MPHWERMLEIYYDMMGWDRKTGIPLPDTLRRLGLGHLRGYNGTVEPGTVSEER